MLDFWKGKKVFITGHTGFNGTWLSSLLLMITGYALNPLPGELFDRLHLNKKMQSLLMTFEIMKAYLRVLPKAILMWYSI